MNSTTKIELVSIWKNINLIHKYKNADSENNIEHQYDNMTNIDAQWMKHDEHDEHDQHEYYKYDECFEYDDEYDITNMTNMMNIEWIYRMNWYD